MEVPPKLERWHGWSGNRERAQHCVHPLSDSPGSLARLAGTGLRGPVSAPAQRVREAVWVASEPLILPLHPLQPGSGCGPPRARPFLGLGPLQRRVEGRGGPGAGLRCRWVCGMVKAEITLRASSFTGSHKSSNCKTGHKGTGQMLAHSQWLDAHPQQPDFLGPGG